VGKDLTRSIFKRGGPRLSKGPTLKAPFLVFPCGRPDEFAGGTLEVTTPTSAPSVGPPTGMRGRVVRPTTGGDFDLPEESGPVFCLDMRWRSGHFGFDPTVPITSGNEKDSQESGTNGLGRERVEADMMPRWVSVDIIGSFQAGPYSSRRRAGASIHRHRPGNNLA